MKHINITKVLKVKAAYGDNVTLHIFTDFASPDAKGMILSFLAPADIIDDYIKEHLDGVDIISQDAAMQ